MGPLQQSTTPCWRPSGSTSLCCWACWAGEDQAERAAIQAEPPIDHPLVAEAIRLFDAVVIDAWEADDRQAQPLGQQQPQADQPPHDQQAAGQAFDQLLGKCQRCGSQQMRDIPIHDGQSTRRECGSCGRFLDFPRWRQHAEQSRNGDARGANLERRLTTAT